MWLICAEIMKLFIVNTVIYIITLHDYVVR